MIRSPLRTGMFALLAIHPANAACLLEEFCAEPLLPHVRFRTTIIEYVDIGQTGVGHSLSRLNWREALTAISDVAGAGVIYALDRNDVMNTLIGTGTVTVEGYLAGSYHQEALEIAEAQLARLAVWGSVLEDGGEILSQLALSVFDPAATGWLSVKLTGDSSAVDQLTITMPAWRINFAPQLIAREALFSRPLLSRCGLSAGCEGGIDVRSGPSNDAPVVGTIGQDLSIEVTGIEEQWFTLFVDEEQAFLNLYHTEIIPQQVTLRPGALLRAEPRTSAAILPGIEAGTTMVVETAALHNNRIWLKLSSGAGVGWAHDGSFISHYAHPITHMVAGFTRYGRGDPDGAAQAFQAFVTQADQRDNVAMSVAYQMMALSLLQNASSRQAAGQALQAIATAQEFTPFDPAPYVLEGAIRLQVLGDTKRGVEVLNRAAALDQADPVVAAAFMQLCSKDFAGRTRLACGPFSLV